MTYLNTTDELNRVELKVVDVPEVVECVLLMSVEAALLISVVSVPSCVERAPLFPELVPSAVEVAATAIGGLHEQ